MPAIKYRAAQFTTETEIKQGENIPKKIIHPDDVLFICILGIDSYGGTRLYPDISSVLLHPTVVLRHTLTLIQHWGKKQDRDIVSRLRPNDFSFLENLKSRNRSSCTKPGVLLCILNVGYH